MRFFDQFEIYCQTPGVKSGKAASYSRAIEYLCDFVNIKNIDDSTISWFIQLENDIIDKKSDFYKSFLRFLEERGQKSYLDNGYVRAALKYFFGFYYFTFYPNREWTKEELTLALALYCKIPLETIGKDNIQIIELSKRIGRVPQDLVEKMLEYRIFDKNDESTKLSCDKTLEQSVWVEYHSNMDSLAKSVERIPHMSDILKYNDDIPEGNDVITSSKIRQYQNYFRSTVISSYDYQCCITGLRIRTLLVAGHIKPWAKSDPKTERTNPCNGLSLNPLHHEAFDKGIFTIDTDYKIVLSKKAKEKYTSDVFCEFFEKYEGRKIILPYRFVPSKEMIVYHNNNLTDF